MQTGAYDCGVFAIAYSTDIAYSLDPVNSLFRQGRMRRRPLVLYQCLNAGRLTSLSTLRQRLKITTSLTGCKFIYFGHQPYNYVYACMCKAGKISPLMRWGVGMTCSLACLRIVTEALVLSCHCVLIVILRGLCMSMV